MRTAAGLVQAPTAAVTPADLVVCRPIDVFNLIPSAEQGDHRAARTVAAVNAALQVIDTALRRRSPLLCATCPQPLLPGVKCAIVLTLPECGTVGHGLALAVCRYCATGRAEIHRKAVLALRQEALGLRVIEGLHPRKRWA